MTVTDSKYVRVYYDKFAREFPEVWADAELGWTWLKLLVASEKSWPIEAEVPRSVKPRTVQRLVDAGLVTLLPPHSFRIRGLDAERVRRQDAARKAAAQRWLNERNAAGNADAMPNRREQRTEEEDERVNGALKETGRAGLRPVDPPRRTA